MGIIILLGIIALAYVAYNNSANKSLRRTPFQRESSPLEIIKARYANGEISRDEYERLKVELDY